MTCKDEQMEQLFTNTTVFGEMEPWAQEALRERAGGFFVQIRGENSWNTVYVSRFHEGSTYRLKRPEFAMPEWFWDALRDDYKYAAMDKEGTWVAFGDKPGVGEGYWHGNDVLAHVNSMVFNLPKHPDWRNSLQVRPGHTDE